MRQTIQVLALAALISSVAASAQTLPTSQPFQNTSISFEENRGQVDSQVRFLAHMGSSSLFLTPSEAVLALYSQDRQKHIREADLRIHWIDGNRTPSIVAEAPLPGVVNYLAGKDPSAWHTGIPTFAKARYQAIYPGVDAIFYGHQGALEYDLVLAPGADLKAVRFAFDGAQQINIAKNGDLVLALDGGEVRQALPAVYQEVDGHRHLLAAKYVIAADRSVGFEVRGADPKRTLVIDPTLAYSTFLGSTTPDSVNSVAVDQLGQVYATGSTVNGFPTKNPAQKGQLGLDAFVTKFSANGGSIVYSTYLGGSSFDVGYAIAVDSGGNAYVGGETDSTDFPFTAASYQSPNTDSDNGFLVKLSSSGSTITYAVKLGGGDSDSVSAIALDSQHRVYAVGATCSYNFPTVNAFQPVNNSQNCADGGQSAFVTRLNAAGTALDYSTYLNGTFASSGRGVAVDSTYHAYVTGTTESPDFPVTAGAFQTTMPAPGDTIGVMSSFVTKFSPDGTSLVYSTFLGGSATDQANAIAVDSSNRAYVTGSATSPDFPVTSGAFQKTRKGPSDAFVTKLWATGGGLIYSTLLGGSGGDGGASIAVDSLGQAHVVGATNSTTFPVKNAIQSTNHGGTDAFVTKLSASGGSLIYSTYLGGSGSDNANCIRLDANDAAYVGGSTKSSNFPTTTGAYDRTYNGQGDGWVTKINP